MPRVDEGLDEAAYVCCAKLKRAPKRGSPPRPTNACGSLHTLRADHVEKRDPPGADNKPGKHAELDNVARLEKRTLPKSEKAQNCDEHHLSLSEGSLRISVARISASHDIQHFAVIECA